MIRSPCCGSEICFACKSHGWHDLCTCQQLRMEHAGQRAQFCPQCGVPTERNGGCPHMACVCGADWTWMSLFAAIQTGDVELIRKYLEIEGYSNDSDDGETVMSSVVRMSPPDIDLVKLILDKGGNPHEDGLLESAVVYASLAAKCGKIAEAQMREDMALFLMSRGACGRVPKRHRRSCPARLAALLDCRDAWVSGRAADLAEEDHVSLQRKLDRDSALSTSRLREVVKSTRKREKHLRMKNLRRFERLSKRGGRHKAGESKLEVMV